MNNLSREICGIPAWLMQEYLQEAGGEVMGKGQVAGDGWNATITEIDPFCLGSIRIGMIRIEFEGQTQAIEHLMVLLEPKLMRAGG